jgi:hypothetical protein
MFKTTELKLAEMSFRYLSKDYRLDISAARLQRMKNPEDPNKFVPMEHKLVKYMQWMEDEKWTEPLEVKETPNYMKKPFYFYGGYTQLNAQEGYELAENSVLRYYLVTIKELSDAKAHLESELDTSNYLN